MQLPASVVPSFLCFGVAFVALASACSSSSSSNGATAGTGTTNTSTSDAGAATAAATSCTKNADCDSKVCNIGTSLCATATATDGVANEDETDIDCGGSVAKKCDQQQKCKVASDCSTGVCTNAICQAPTNTDGVKNGNETGIDCGSTGNPTCADGQGCAVRDDCKNQYCKAGICTAPTPADGVKDGTETDVDCGGEGNPPCADGKVCATATDCNSSVCTNAICQVPTSTDHVKNGTETSVDCGGAGNPTCNAVTDTCLAGTDCTSGGCDYTNHCALKRSCTAHYGGDTCGYGGDGSLGAATYESCCATAPVTPSGGTAVQLGKYQVTAGRFRTFLESVNGDVRTFIQTARAAGKVPAIPGNTAHTVIDAAWDTYLPTSMDGDDNETPDCDNDGYKAGCGDDTKYAPMYTSAANHVGPTIFKRNSQPDVQGCNYTSPGTHMYWLGATDYWDETADYAQSVYDQKSMQCVDQMMAEAFCIWDGGRLETLAEWAAAWGSNSFPWAGTPSPKNQGFSTYNACRFPTATDAILRGANPGKCTADLIPGATQSIEYANWEGSYEWPSLIDDGNDFAPYISAPGRTSGRGPAGHADILGNLLEMTSNMNWNADPFSASSTWAGNGSWEVHGYNARNANGSYAVMDKYGKQGLRCAYP